MMVNTTYQHNIKTESAIIYYKRLLICLKEEVKYVANVASYDKTNSWIATRCSGIKDFIRTMGI